MSILLLILFNDFSLSLSGDTEKLALGIINKVGVDMYVFFSQFFSILLPAIIFLLIYHFKNLREWIRIKLPGDLSFFMYGLMLLFLAYPLIQFSAILNQKLPIADWLMAENEIAGQITKMILDFDSPFDFVVRIILVAILPAIAEELFFRAGIQNELLKGIRNPDIAIIIAALVFSAFHMQFDGFLPRFFLGMIMGYLYYWSSSIYVPILVHFANNLMLLISAYFVGEATKSTEIEQLPQIPLYILLMSAIAIFILRNKMINMKLKENSINNQT